jgi:hypothetical protein
MANGKETGENQEQTKVAEQERLEPPKTRKEWEEWELTGP